MIKIICDPNGFDRQIRYVHSSQIRQPVLTNRLSFFISLALHKKNLSQPTSEKSLFVQPLVTNLSFCVVDFHNEM